MIEPLRLAFEVGCPVAHAFDVWTDKISRWWPADHSVSGEARLRVVLEGWPGGRIFERTSTGAEFEWGEVTVWEPPRRPRPGPAGREPRGLEHARALVCALHRDG